MIQEISKCVPLWVYLTLVFSIPSVAPLNPFIPKSLFFNSFQYISLHPLLSQMLYLWYCYECSVILFLFLSPSSSVEEFLLSPFYSNFCEHKKKTLLNLFKKQFVNLMTISWVPYCRHYFRLVVIVALESSILVNSSYRRQHICEFKYFPNITCKDVFALLKRLSREALLTK
jgi:hypothetical protein